MNICLSNVRHLDPFSTCSENRRSLSVSPSRTALGKISLQVTVFGFPKEIAISQPHNLKVKPIVSKFHQKNAFQCLSYQWRVKNHQTFEENHKHKTEGKVNRKKIEESSWEQKQEIMLEMEENIYLTLGRQQKIMHPQNKNKIQ